MPEDSTDVTVYGNPPSLRKALGSVLVEWRPSPACDPALSGSGV